MNYTLPKQIGNYNKNQMLSILREKGPTSRVELSRLLRISPTAITRNTSQLLKTGIIKECGADQSNMGRKPVLMELCNDFCYVLGADIVGGTLKTALADLMGKILTYYEEPIEDSKGARAVLDQMINALRKTIDTSAVPREKIWVTTIGAPGVFDPDKGKSSVSFFLDGWDDIDIRLKVFEALSIETFVENDVNLDVIGESWKGRGKDYESILYVKLGQGLAARVVLQNKLLRGKHNMAGEIGYMLPGIARNESENYENMLCNAAVAKRYSELTGENSIHTISGLHALAESGNTGARAGIRYLLDHLAIVLINSITVLDPQVIILGGDACCFGEKELASLKESIESELPMTQTIITSQLDNKACLYGAIKTGLDRVEERITASW